MALSPTVLNRLSGLADRYDEICTLLARPEVLDDRSQFTALSKELAELEPVVKDYRQITDVLRQIEESRELADSDDPELQELAREEIVLLGTRLAELERSLKKLLIPTDPHDGSNVFLEIRAGTGGDEAALFSGDLFRMYARFVEHKGWNLEILNERHGEHGGYKEVITRVDGKRAYSQLKFESGVHRVQRVPDTESQGRIHTSACTVAVLPEVDDIDAVDIEKSDLRVDLFRASGAGGQHVNKTDSAVRLTHLPSGIVVECQDERSQHKNRARAMALLQAKLLDAARSEQQAEQAESRRNLVGSGDRSERIRTYNFPQGRVTDHRINLTLYRLDEVLHGELDTLVQPLIQQHQADQLGRLGDE